MPNQITTDEQTIKLKWKVVVPIVGFLLLSSNLFTRYITVIQTNETRINYNDAAASRRMDNKILISEFNTEIKRLNRELKNCKDGI